MPRATEGFDVHIYKLIDPVVPFFCKLNIHPNVVTLFALALNLFVFKNNPSIFLALFILLLDFLDGEVARQCKKTGKIGSVLDSINDALFNAIIMINILRLDVSFLNIFIFASIRMIVDVSINDITEHGESHNYFLIVGFLISLMWARVK
jgi:phosphatidylglycerophosphate synthase